MLADETSPDARSGVKAAEEPTRGWLTGEQERVWRSWLAGVARIDAHLSQSLRSTGLDLSEYEILVRLSEAPDREMRMSELADEVDQSRSRLTHTITRMEKSGLVVRRRCKGDGRGVWAHLTDEGYELLLAAAPGHVDAVRECFVDVADPADFEALGRVMDAVLMAHADRQARTGRQAQAAADSIA